MLSADSENDHLVNICSNLSPRALILELRTAIAIWLGAERKLIRVRDAFCHETAFSDITETEA